MIFFWRYSGLDLTNIAGRIFDGLGLAALFFTEALSCSNLYYDPVSNGNI